MYVGTRLATKTSRSMMHRYPGTRNSHTAGWQGPHKSPGPSAYNAQNHAQASRKAVNLMRAAAHWQKPQKTTTPIGLAWASQCRHSSSHAGIRGYSLP